MGKLLVVVAGPTAVGKTQSCIDLAKVLETVVISADSRQFYREISIGTAKPSPEELAQVPHYFIDNLSVAEDYNAGRFETDCLALLETLFQSKQIVILTGGSGLFIKAVTEGFDDLPDINPETRAQLNQEFELNGLEPLLSELKQRDPVYYSQVDKANYRRVLRALEIIRETGSPFSSFRKNASKFRPFRILKIGLERPREELYKRIDERVDIMIGLGLVEEVKSVAEYRQKPALNTVGYSEIFDFMDGKQGWDETVRLIKRNTRHFAKRQLTWFRKDIEFNWFHPDQFQEILNLINQTSKNLK